MEHKFSENEEFWQGGGTFFFFKLGEKTEENTLFYYLNIFVCVCFHLWLTKIEDKLCLAGIQGLMKSCHLFQKKIGAEKLFGV